jgi:hypothetical protein
MNHDSGFNAISDHLPEKQQVVELAVSLGLHGIFILAKECPRCGACHERDFTVLTDLDPDFQHDPLELMETMTQHMRDSPPIDHEWPKGTEQ